jgi:chromosome segregation ATPase
VRAPYTTTHCRIPTPIKSTVESLATAYKILIGAEDLEACKNLLKSTNEAISNLGEAEQEINQLKADLAEANKHIELLKSERENMIKSLKPTLEMKSRDGVKMKELIREAFPELIDPSISKLK